MPLVLVVSLCSSKAFGEESNAGAQAQTTEHPAASTPTGSVFVDPLGLLLFGPTLGGEVALNHVSIGLYGRWLNAGYLARQMFPNSDLGEEFAFSYGVGLRGRYYINGSLRGLFAGVAAEYLHSRIENTTDQIATKAQLIVPELEFGYRHALGSFYVGGVAGIGYAFEVASSVENLPGGTRAHLFEVEDASTVYGSAGLEIGLYF
jgi:hypothetical protein